MDAEIARLEDLSASADFWNNRNEAESVISNLNVLKRKVEAWRSIRQDFDDFCELLELAISDNDVSMESELASQFELLRSEFDKVKLAELLSGEFDRCDAYLTIHSGAGGTEACDWVSMLYRMYSRWADINSYKFEILDLLEAEGGIKSVTVLVKGAYAMGYLKSETGVHRLVRISPFDSNSRRHTSFASVFVSPVIDDSISVDIKPDEIRVDTYRASGAGGQHVNKTDSAVRITHLETGIVVQCQNERSQLKNKKTAMNILKSRLYDFYKAKQDEENSKDLKEKKDISWGNQIRSYVFQPYTLVKDARTKFEIGNVSSVMDGNVMPFMEAYLKWSCGEAVE